MRIDREKKRALVFDRRGARAKARTLAPLLVLARNRSPKNLQASKTKKQKQQCQRVTVTFGTSNHPQYPSRVTVTFGARRTKATCAGSLAHRRPVQLHLPWPCRDAVRSRAAQGISQSGSSQSRHGFDAA